MPVAVAAPFGLLAAKNSIKIGVFREFTKYKGCLATPTKTDSSLSLKKSFIPAKLEIFCSVFVGPNNP